MLFLVFLAVTNALGMLEEGADGQTVNFRAEDDFGKIAVCQTTNTPAYYYRMNGDLYSKCL